MSRLRSRRALHKNIPLCSKQLRISVRIGAGLARALQCLSSVGARFLIIDDEESILFAMKEYFGMLGYTVDCASDLPAANALLRTAEYALIMADLRLGGSGNQDGLEIIARAHRCYPKTRIILLTAYGSPSLTADARSRGATFVLNKPVSLPILARIVTELLENRP